MRNVDVLLPSPWEMTMTANGAVIPEGAGSDYRGPCPGEFQRHRYRFTVTALDTNGRALGQAQVTVAEELKGAHGRSFWQLTARRGIQAVRIAAN